MRTGELGPLVPVSGLGAGVRRVVAGPGAEHVLVVAGDKMVHLHSADTVQHTWYADTGTSVVTAACGGGRTVILANTRTLVIADTARNKIEDCDKVELPESVHDIVTVEDILWVVFSNGAVEQLEYFLTRAPDTWVTVAGLLGEGDTILESRVSCAPGGYTAVAHLVAGAGGDQLRLVAGRVVLDTETRAHSVADTAARQLDTSRDQLLAAHLDPGARLLMVARDTVLMLSSVTAEEEEIVSLPPGSKHVAITHVSDTQLAVMGSLSEGGYLQTVSTLYRCVVAAAAVKTTSHSGRGLSLVRDKLYVCAGTRVATVRPGPGGLDTVLGRMAAPTTRIQPELEGDMLGAEDMSEDVILDCVVSLLDTEAEDEDEERQLGLVRSLVCRDISQPIMGQLMTDKLNTGQVIRLLGILEKLLNSDEGDLEEKVIDWVNLLVTGHYLQMVMCKDQELDLMRSRLHKTVSNIQEKLQTLSECKVVAKNLLSTKVPPVKMSNQIYSIEIIQI